MGILPAMSPWRAVGGDYGFVMLDLGTAVLEILSALSCHPPMDDFQSYPHL